LIPDKVIIMASAFEKLMATLDYPLYVVTTAVEGERSGCLIGFATQCSIHPPRFLACISKKNHTYEVARRAHVLGVHVLDEKDVKLAQVFGGETGDEVDKFAHVAWRYGNGGVPVLDACQRWFAGSVLDRFDLGDHVGFLIEPIETGQDAADEQLTFQQARDIEPGHQP
jgi:flavin reductase (DIM6/NTAB) family NADH-FMN oxidoreductase RutF